MSSFKAHNTLALIVTF